MNRNGLCLVGASERAFDRPPISFHRQPIQPPSIGRSINAINAMQRRDDFQTDALRPAALPTASLKPLRTGAAAAAAATGAATGGGAGGAGGGPSLEERFHAMDQSSEAYLDASYEDWNKKVDVEVDTLVDGMVHLVNIASVGTKDRHRVAQEAFEAQCRTESMVGAVFDFTHSHSHSPPFSPPQVRAATSLLSITHSLKLLLLLSDEQQIATRRDRAAERFARKTEHERALAAQTLDSLLSKGSGGGRPPRDQDDT